MKTLHIFLFCILAAALVSMVVCSEYVTTNVDDCCFSYYPRRIKRTIIQSYYRSDERCDKPAVILVTLRSRRVCVDPNLSWVKGIMDYLDEQSF